MINEKDVNVITDQLLYVNSKGKRVKRKPRICVGAFYILELGYENQIVEECFFIGPDQLGDEQRIQSARQVLFDKLVKQLGN